MNRRGFISSLAGLVALVKAAKPQSMLSAWEAIRPHGFVSSSTGDTGMFRVGDEVDIFRLDGTITGKCKVESIDESNNTMWLSSPMPPDVASLMVVQRSSDGGVA